MHKMCTHIKHLQTVHMHNMHMRMKHVQKAYMPKMQIRMKHMRTVHRHSMHMHTKHEQTVHRHTCTRCTCREMHMHRITRCTIAHYRWNVQACDAHAHDLLCKCSSPSKRTPAGACKRPPWDPKSSSKRKAFKFRRRHSHIPPPLARGTPRGTKSVEEHPKNPPHPSWGRPRLSFHLGHE